MRSTRVMRSRLIEPKTIIIASGSTSNPAAVGDILLIGHDGGFVGSKEQGHARHIVRHERPLQALSLHSFGVAFGRHPERKLPLGHDPARRDGEAAHIMLAVSA